MKPRFLQFSLRWLLGFALIVCLSLGGRHLLETYGSYVEASTSVGKPMIDGATGQLVKNERILVRGRAIRLFGPSEIEYSLSVVCPGQWKTPVDFRSKNWLAERSWLCLYEMDAETSPIGAPGEYEVGVVLGGRSNTPLIRKKVIVEPR